MNVKFALRVGHQRLNKDPGLMPWQIGLKCSSATRATKIIILRVSGKTLVSSASLLVYLSNFLSIFCLNFEMRIELNLLAPMDSWLGWFYLTISFRFDLRPLISNIPKLGWKCKNCRVCGDCGSRTPGSGPSSRWHACFTVCDSCYQQRNKGVSCPMQVFHSLKTFIHFYHPFDLNYCWYFCWYNDFETKILNLELKLKLENGQVRQSLSSLAEGNEPVPAMP